MDIGELISLFVVRVRHITLHSLWALLSSATVDVTSISLLPSVSKETIAPPESKPENEWCYTEKGILAKYATRNTKRSPRISTPLHVANVTEAIQKQSAATSEAARTQYITRT